MSNLETLSRANRQLTELGEGERVLPFSYDHGSLCILFHHDIPVHPEGLGAIF
jgi:hypothetical protein